MPEMNNERELLYNEQISRNIGLISREEQREIRNTPIAILGLGGLGGSVVEQLVRVGCENIVICDNDKFDRSNLNRQICSVSDIGKDKVKVIEKLVFEINPNVNLVSFKDVSQRNVNDMLNNVRVVALTLDDPYACIRVTRFCKKMKIDVIESYGIPYLWVWWFTNKNIDYETCYNLNTNEITLEEIENIPNFMNNFYQALLSILLKLPEIQSIYNRQKGVLKEILEGKRPLVSLAPIVRMSASFIAFEIILSGILKIKEKVLAPNIVGYDYFHMKSINLKIQNSKIGTNSIIDKKT